MSGAGSSPVPRDNAIVVTGSGLTVPSGLSVSEAWTRALNAESAIRESTRFDLSGCRFQASAEVPEFELSSTLRLPKTEKFMSPSARWLVRAAKEALCQARVELSQPAAERIAIYVSCGYVGPEPSEFFSAFN